MSTPGKCNLKWVHSADGKVPANAMASGYDSNAAHETFYICRGNTSGDLEAGKVNNHLHCHISFGGKEVILNKDFDVLVNDSTDKYDVEWVPRHDGDPLPQGAVLAGHSHLGEPVYVGRCTTATNSVVIGKIHKTFYYAYGGKEYKDCHNHEVLVCLS